MRNVIVSLFSTLLAICFTMPAFGQGTTVIADPGYIAVSPTAPKTKPKTSDGPWVITENNKEVPGVNTMKSTFKPAGTEPADALRQSYNSKGDGAKISFSGKKMRYIVTAKIKQDGQWQQVADRTVNAVNGVGEVKICLPATYQMHVVCYPDCKDCAKALFYETCQ